MSCQGPEEETLGKFFDAVRSGDHVTLAGMSVVGFSGPVESWRVVEVSSESLQPFRLPGLRRQAAAAEEERERQFHAYSEFHGDHRSELKEIRDRIDKDPDYRFRGRWGEIQAEWERYREKYEALDRKRQVLLREIDKELKLSKMSLMSSEEVDRLDGEVIVREVLLKVSKPDAGEKPYLFELRKYELSSEEGTYQPPSRWIVTAIEER